MPLRLTAERRARFPEFVEKWTRIGLCTDPANRPAAEEGVRLSYKLARLDPPKKIVWCGSPLSLARARNLIRKPLSMRGDLLWVRKVTVSVRRRVSSPFLDSVLSLVGGPISLSVWSSVGIPVRLSVCASVRASGWWSARDSIDGQQDASWNAIYDYYRVVCGLTEPTEKMLGIMQVAENAGWWLPYRDICLISERPNRLIRNDRGRLHCEDGPALSYPDGWSIYAIHGVLVDEQVVMHPRTQSINKIRNETNAEVKRVRIERFGWPEYLRAARAVVVDTRDNEVEATKEALMQTPDGDVVLVCACPSTSRVYSLLVPPTTTTCEGAQDWLSGGLSARVINGA